MSCSFCLCWREWNRILHLARQKGSTYQLQETPNKLNWEKQATARNTLVLSYIFKNDFQVILPLWLTHWTNIKALMESEILTLSPFKACVYKHSPSFFLTQVHHEGVNGEKCERRKERDIVNDVECIQKILQKQQWMQRGKKENEWTKWMKNHVDWKMQGFIEKKTDKKVLLSSDGQ